MDDDRLIAMAAERGWIAPAEMDRLRRERQALADRGVDHSLWFLAQDLGLITDDQARELRRSISSTRLRALEVDGFVLEGRLGAGGMGDVFRARHADGRLAAVKLLASRLSKNPEHRRRFAREARAGLRLRHPHIVPALAAGEVAGTPYLLMELVEGESLKARIGRAGPLTDAEARVLLRQMGEGLAFAWNHGVLHRDVKPANMIIGPPRPGHGEPFCARLIDFGLAKVWQEGGGEADPESIGGLTGAGLALGTPHYMSPEQAAGQQDLDQRCDIYGLAASLYHALLGSTLYSGKSSAVIMYKQVTEKPDLQQLLVRGVSPELVALLDRMLAKRRDARIATWTEVLAAVGGAPPAPPPAAAPLPAADPPPPAPAAPAVRPGIAEDPPAAAPPRQPVPPTAIPPPRRRIAAIALGVAASVALLAGGGWMALGSGRPAQARPETLAGILAHPHAQEIRLAPGDYPAIRLGVAASGTTLIAPAGARLAGLVAEPGLRSARIVGIAVTGALEALPGSELRCEDAALDGPVRITGAALACVRTAIAGPVDGVDGAIAIADARISGPLSLRQCRSEIVRTRCAADGVAPAIGIEGGRLRLDAVAIAAAGDGMRCVGVEELILTDVAIEAGGTALTAAACALPQLDGVDLIGRGGVALRWQGPRDPRWVWTRLRAQAALPVSGLDGVELSPVGARGERLAPP